MNGGSAPGRERSVDPCPVCGRHDLALEQPPHIAVAGIQPFTELYRMGDLPMPVGVRCRSCGNAWPTIAALRAGEPGSAEAIDPTDGVDEPTDIADEPVDGLDEPEPPRTATPRGGSSTARVVGVVAAVGGAAILFAAGLLELAFIVVGAVVLAVRAIGGRRRRS